MDISVIIPTYKPKDYIWECLNSLYNQKIDKNKFEVIIILNGCGEPWNSQLINWMDSHPKLNVGFYNTAISGVSNARNIGLKFAKGKYITFIDDDDYVSDSYLLDMMNVSEQYPTAVVISNSLSFKDGTNEFNQNYPLRKVFYKLKNKKTPINLYSARSMFNGPCMKFIPRCIIGNVQFDIDFPIGEDTLYMYEISKSISSIKMAPETAVYYRRFRENSAITSKRSRKYLIKHQLRFYSKIITIYKNNFTQYSLLFTISRFVAPIKSLLYQFFR